MMEDSDSRPLFGPCHALLPRSWATVAWPPPRMQRFHRLRFRRVEWAKLVRSRTSATVTEEASALSTDCEPRELLEPRPAADVQPLVAERKTPREAVAPGRGRRLGLALSGLLVLGLGWVAGSNTQL